MSRHLGDAENIQLVEFLCLAVEACRTAEALVGVALERLAGLEPDFTELRHDALRLASMLDSVASMDPATETSR